MKTFKTPVITVLLLALGWILSGCSLNTQKNTSIPWNRPANWEGQIPGMGSTPGAGIR